MSDDDGTPPYRRPDLDTDERVSDLLDRMTLEEKAGQLVGTWGGHLRAEQTFEDVADAVRDHHLGVAAPFGWAAPLATDPTEAAEIANDLQRIAREETRLGIPLLFNVDAVHGHAYVADTTVFPNGLGAAATWDPELVEESAQLTAREMRRTGAHQNYSPTCDVGRDPRWGRTFETFGESPLLCAKMAAAKIRGYRGSDEPVLATAKHFPAYSEPERGEDASPVDVSEYKLRNTFVRPFEDALAAGVDSVMPSYNSVDGEPSHSSRTVLTDLLREELGFDGHVVSDWNGVRQLADDHRTARDQRDAVRQAHAAGLDVASVGSVEHAENLVDLAERGELDEETLDASVRRVLERKFELGLFEDPYVDADEASERVGTDDHREVAREAARASMTLLENDGILPLSGDEDVFVGGPNADDIVHQLGGWSVLDADVAAGETILEALRSHAERSESDASITYEQGATLNETLDLDTAAEKAAEADVAVLALGEGWYLHEFGPAEQAGVPTGEWPTRSELGLSEAQRELARRVHETGTPVVGVLVAGRPLAVDWLHRNASGLLMAYYPGTEGGRAVAETLFGESDPRGRLPISVPRSAGDLPQHHDHLAHPRPIGDDEHPPSYAPLYEFGHGLSYTTFEYDGVAVERDELGEGDELDVTVTVSNTGDRPGTETVHVYGNQAVSSRVRPERWLVGFGQVSVDPGESETLAVSIPATEFGFYKPGEGHVVESGDYRISVGDDEASFEIVD
ncbi:glycoside hydrolase family 3 N-terminal domain-containing protein [Haloprofundus salinisoli]|uniref:glycoside hydrolase family 3 N-terminal domain-containing protein n=1 Tax=Haloprofundus salinisoli TaxID=2876193 RepID=UPI001CCCBFCA|nr:glycoside hydrolase family 3 N-terminal domain-containing protein [Haloprofundus salinisoli]